ncbi:malonate decarboxylase holo-ACP synthase [Winogradskya humida]|uniref:Malonate decarboxylase holo-ACP synthase n=1 Tax=Winogradskya humida TaxID=113566 RepID=A0ABQ4A6B0_9ACTN|nr:malonate decarboxylase holo-ACP synthase [Actinoplanes humidus]GIE26396.1 malonate decarboxylase holo-ACP synthase [Actinoplanes humidus]
MTPQVHDLLHLGDLDAVRRANPDAPPWVWQHLAPSAWVVVRRPEASNGLIPAGARGDGRTQRQALDVPEASITEVVTPHQLTTRLLDQPPAGAIAEAMAMLRGWFTALDAAGLDWGPVGAVGFELATGRRVTRASSDLDIVIRITDWPGPAVLWQPPATPVRLDCLLESPAGAVAWAEAASDATDVLWRTSSSPRLAGNPRLAAARSAA